MSEPTEAHQQTPGERQDSPMEATPPAGVHAEDHREDQPGAAPASPHSAEHGTPEGEERGAPVHGNEDASESASGSAADEVAGDAPQHVDETPHPLSEPAATTAAPEGDPAESGIPQPPGMSVGPLPAANQPDVTANAGEAAHTASENWIPTSQAEALEAVAAETEPAPDATFLVDAAYMADTATDAPEPATPTDPTPIETGTIQPAGEWQAEGLWQPPQEVEDHTGAPAGTLEDALQTASRPPDEVAESVESETGREGPVSQDFDRTWQRIEDAFENKRDLSALAVDRVKGGLVVDIGVQGFVPASQIGSGKLHDLDRYVGRTLKLRITDLDRERQRVVLSARIPQEEEHLRRKKETMQHLKVGLIADGVVRRLTDFGAFVDIGGVDGLLHVSEMSWSRVQHPREVVNPGDHIKVKVLKISDDKKKISLGMRQLLPDPWSHVEEHFKVGDTVTGRVVRSAQFGAFVQLREGIEAILPNSELPGRKPRPEDVPHVGDTVNAKVIELRPDQRRMTLSVRRIQEDEERQDYRQHVQAQSSTAGSRTTIGDLFGDILSDWNEDKVKTEDEAQ